MFTFSFFLSKGSGKLSIVFLLVLPWVCFGLSFLPTPFSWWRSVRLFHSMGVIQYHSIRLVEIDPAISTPAVLDQS